MKRLNTAVLTALFALGLGLTAVAAPAGSASLGNIGYNVIAQVYAGCVSGCGNAYGVNGSGRDAGCKPRA